MITKDQGKILVKLARNAIETYFSQESIDLEPAKDMKENRGVFVTLKKHEELRGCIGYPEPIFPLFRGVVQAARGAAFQDPRFPQVTEDELDDLTIELTVLTLPKKITVDHWDEYLKRIHIGMDGLIIKSGPLSGLLLPQVAKEYHWTVKDFLEHTCQKAGLDKDAWKDLDNEIFSFQGQIFSEKEPKGEVVIH